MSVEKLEEHFRKEQKNERDRVKHRFVKHAGANHFRGNALHQLNAFGNFHKGTNIDATTHRSARDM